MVPPPANVRRHFISWDRPLLPQAVTWLAGDWTGQGPLDLTRLLVVVPTRQSGRRLREALAIYAEKYQQAVFPPRVLTPEILISLNIGSDVASRFQSLLAWAQVFADIELDQFREVFPIDPPARNFAWKLRLGRVFMRLQSTLAENALRFEDVAKRAGPNFAETNRWLQLAELEQIHAARLAALGLHEPQAARIRAVQNPPAFPDVDKIIVLAAPDPLPLALTYLSAQTRLLPLEVVVFAPAAEAETFDEWGRPEAAAWTERELAIPEFEQRVQLCADPAAQAQRVTDFARAYVAPEGLLGVGVADPEILPLLANALARADIPAFNPEGRPRRRGGLHYLLTALAALVRDDSFANVETLARCPEFLDLLRRRFGDHFSTARWLASLDKLRATHLPADLANARSQAGKSELAAGLAVVEELRARLSTDGFAGSAAATLGTLFEGRRLDLSRGNDAQFTEAAEAWMEIVRECAAAAADFPNLGNTEWWEVALQLHGDDALTEEKADGAVELQGWLELLWEDAPHLVVAGLNDGRVPDAVVGDAFLPEILRAQVGLKTNATRFARDAFIFQAVNACRTRVDWLFGKTSIAGDPLRPSRLLLRCKDDELPARIAFLFRAPALAKPSLPWRRAWRLTPRLAAPPTRIRVTALRDYLRCPFRFYLRHVLRMESIDPAKTELDAFDFGTLCHAALEQIGLQPSLRECTDAGELRKALWLTFDRAVREQFGANLTLPLVIQCESARQRLAKAAEVQAKERASG